MRMRAVYWLALLLTGCSLAPSDKVLEQLANSERSWCFSGTSVYGAIRMGGSGLRGGTMNCNQEGLSLKATGSEPIEIPLSVQMTPTITVGPMMQAAPSPTR